MRGGAANRDMVDFEKIKMDGSGPIYMQLIAFVKHQEGCNCSAGTAFD